MKPIYVQGVGIAAPGLDGWAQARAVLRGEAAYVPAEIPSHPMLLLPPNERRRAPPAVRLAFRAAEDAVAGSGQSAAELASVFASSDADTAVIHRICSALAQPTRLISPTDFHNSVHNAAPGYWSIAQGCRQPSISLSAWDETFAAGLLEAGALALGDGVDVLLVAYDVLPPSPLLEARGIAAAAGVALVLSAEPREGSVANLRLELLPDARALSALNEPSLEALRLASPAARALPLLQALAQAEPASVTLPATGGSTLRIVIEPRA